jgi:ABC-type branched-subunit amino acid transport system substrate-binding protein
VRSKHFALAGLAMVALTATACSSSTPTTQTTASTTTAPSGGSSAGNTASAPGVTATSVTVGQVDDISAPVAGLFKGAEDGTKAYFDYVNSTGGVNGRKLVLDARDSAFQGGTVTGATSDQIKNDFALVGGFSLLDSSEQPLIDAASMPDVGYPLSPQLADDQNLFSPLPSTSNDYPIGFMKYLAQKYPTAVKHVGVLWANATSATQADEAAFENALKAEGFTIVYDRGFTPFESTFLSDVLRMKSAGVQLFFSTQMPDTYAATLAKEMQQQGFKPIVVQGAAYSSQLLSLAGGSAEGMYIAQQYALYLGQDAGSVPAVKTFDQWVKEADPSANFEIETLYGWASAQLFVQALRDAGQNPTRASLVAALSKITSFDAGGLVPEENPAKNIPAECWLLAQVHNGTITRVSPTPKSGFVCSPGGRLPAAGWQPATR